MNYRLVFNLIGKVLLAEAVLLLFPCLISLIYLEQCALDIGLTALGTAAVALLLIFLVKPKNQYMYAKEGLVITAFSWIFMSLIGAIPFVTSGYIPNYIDALFEIVSGFTTTGASVLSGTQIESMSKGLLFWRSFSHWIGGMGVLVFVLLFTNKNERSMHILRAEMPGPTVDKLVPKARNTAFILYAIYMALTVVLTIMLVCGDMDFYESLVHALGTAGTGGFGIKADSLAGYSHYSQWVIAIFMIIFGVNFNLFYLLIIGKFSTVLKNTEMWAYIVTIVISVALISVNIYTTLQSAGEVIAVGDAVRDSTFQVASVISTTGYSTVDFNKLGVASKTILFVLMFVGGCAGSTAGGLKMTRVIICFKKVGNNLKRVLHPRTQTVVKVDGKKISEDTIDGVTSYLAIYALIFVLVFLLLALDPFTPATAYGEYSALETNLSATAATFNNIGPGFGATYEGYGFYSYFSKIILIFAMLLGRLEIYPILLSFSPRTWKRIK